MSQPTSFDNTCLSILSDVTIVIPSYCRQPFLRRQFNYWSPFPCKIIVLDGSPKRN